jgi:hypothetical protein
MYDLSTMPAIGRNGVRDAVQNMGGMQLTGWRDIDVAAVFVAGQLAKLGTDANGKVCVQPVSAVTDAPIGVFVTSNTTTFYRPESAEAHVIGEDIDAPNSIALKKPYVKGASYVVRDALTGVAYVEGAAADYTINVINGVITNVAIPNATAILVSYHYKDVNLSGINQVLGSGKAALLEQVGAVATLMYDPTAAWTLNAAVKFTADGLFTVGGASATIGRVTKAPTFDDPAIHVLLDLV